MEYYGFGILQFITCYAFIAAAVFVSWEEIWEQITIFWDKEASLTSNILTSLWLGPFSLGLTLLAVLFAAAISGGVLGGLAADEIVYLSENVFDLSIPATVALLLASSILLGGILSFFGKYDFGILGWSDRTLFALQVINVLLFILPILLISVPSLANNFELTLWLPLILFASTFLAVGGWSFVMAVIFLFLKEEALRRRNELIVEDYRSERKLEFFNIKEVLIVEFGWKPEHFDVEGMPYQIDNGDRYATLTLSPKARKDLGRPITKVRDLLNKGRHLVFCKNSLWGEKSVLFEGQVHVPLDEVHAVNVPLSKKPSDVVYSDPLIELSGGIVRLSAMSFPQHILVSRKQIRGRGKLKTLLGW